MTEASQAAARDACEWCGGAIPLRCRRDARTCSKACRQAKARFRVAPATTTARRPMVFAYADPPYPGLARRYYQCPEVDHAALVSRLEDGYPDGWALSTSAAALSDVLALIHVPVRVAVWVRGSRPGVALGARNAWEPVIVAGGRLRRLSVAEVRDDVLLWRGRQHSHPGALVGMKSAAFAEWMFRLLGAERGDRLDDLFPGSGAIGRAWQLYTSLVDERHVAPDVERDASCLAGATRRLASALEASS